jgi:thymidine kinase
MSKLTFVFGAMGSAKSLQLLADGFNYLERGMKVVLLTAAIDDRAGVGIIKSRLGISREAQTFTTCTNFESIFINAKADGIACILIDEVQFTTPEQIRDVHRCVHTYEIPCLAYGIRSDFRGMPFPGSAMLMTLADSIKERATICGCGKMARMNMRIDANGHRVVEGPQIDIGGNDKYLAMCPRCFYTTAPAVAVTTPETVTA